MGWRRRSNQSTELAFQPTNPYDLDRLSLWTRLAHVCEHGGTSTQSNRFRSELDTCIHIAHALHLSSRFRIWSSDNWADVRDVWKETRLVLVPPVLYPLERAVPCS